MESKSGCGSDVGIRKPGWTRCWTQTGRYRVVSSSRLAKSCRCHWHGGEGTVLRTEQTDEIRGGRMITQDDLGWWSEWVVVPPSPTPWWMWGKTRIGAESYGAISCGMACLNTKAPHPGFTTIPSHCSHKYLGELVPWLSFSFSFFLI